MHRRWGGTMARIYINRLSAREREQLVGRRFSVDELKMLHASLLRGQRARMRRLRVLMVVLPLGCLALGSMAASLAGWTAAVLVATAAILVMVTLLLLLTWYLAVGLYARQFNDPVDEGYPELLGRLHL